MLVVLFSILLLSSSSLAQDTSSYQSFFDSYFALGNISSYGLANVNVQLSILNTSTLFSKGYANEKYKSTQPIDPNTSVYMTGPTMSQLVTKLVALRVVPSEKLSISVNEYLSAQKSRISLGDTILGDYVSWSRIGPRVDASSYVTVQSLIDGTSGLDYRPEEDLYVSSNPQSSSQSVSDFIESKLNSRMAPRIRQVKQVKSRIDSDAIALLSHVVSLMNGNQSYEGIVKSELLNQLGMQNTQLVFSQDLKLADYFIRATKTGDITTEDSDFYYYTVFPVTSSIFTTAADLRRVGEYILQTYTERQIQDYNLLNVLRHNDQTYYYLFAKQGTYFSCIILFPQAKLVWTMTGLGLTNHLATQIIQSFAFNMLPNSGCSGYSNVTVEGGRKCTYSALLENVAPQYSSSYFWTWRKKYEGCFINVEYPHTTFRKYFLMKEMICIDSSSSKGYLTGKTYGFDANSPSASSSIPFGSNELILYQDSNYDTFRMGIKQSSTVATFDNYLSNLTWTFKFDAANDRVMFLNGPHDSQRYERFEENISMFLVYLAFGAPFVVGLFIPFAQIIFLVLESRDRIRNGYQNLANVDLSHFMLRGDDYQSSDESDAGESELQERVDEGLRRYSFKINSDRKKKKKKKSDDEILETKSKGGKKWATVISVFSVHIIFIFFFFCLQALNIVTIFAIWQQWYILLVVPLATLGLTVLCLIGAFILMCLRIKLRTISGWIFTIVYFLYVLLDIAFIVMMMKINWFGFWNLM